MTNRCINTKISDLDYTRLFPDISPPEYISNMLDGKSDVEESSSNDYTEYSENICFVISKLWIQREKIIYK